MFENVSANMVPAASICLLFDNLNAEKMLKIYQKCLVTSAEKFYGKNRDNWELQEDNDSKHRSRLCTEWKIQNGITTMNWPVSSPDANPIENVWSYIKHKLRGKLIFTLRQLSTTIRKIWRSLSREYAQKLVESMPRRCQAIIDNGGDWTC